MSLVQMKDWLERVCGPAGDPAPDYSVANDAYTQKSAFLETALGVGLDQTRAELKAAMSGLVLTTKVKKRFLIRDKVETAPVMAEAVDGQATEFAVEQMEWDSYDSLAQGMTAIAKDGESHPIDSEAGQAIVAEMFAKLEPIMELSRQMAAQTKPGSDERLFTDREIEKELWSPLVREGIIPSNLVPQKFSETVNVFRNAAAIYTQTMADEDGTDMGPKKGFDKFLSVSKDVVKWGKTIASESLRYDIFDPAGVNWGGTTNMEASREDLARFIKHNAPSDLDDEGDAATFETLHADPGGTAACTPEGASERTYNDWKASGDDGSYADWLCDEETRLNGEISGLDEDDPAYEGLRQELAEVKDAKTISKGEITYEKWEATGKDQPFDAWLDDEETRLGDLLKDDDLSDSDRLAAEEQLETIKAAQITQAYGEHLQRQAAVNCAGTIATTLVTAAQNKRNRKRATRDTVEELLEGIGDAALQGWSASNDGTAKTMDGDTKEAEFKAKYILLATKAGARAVTKLSHVMAPASRLDDAAKKDLFVSALAEIADLAGETVAATGTAGDAETETRAERASYGMIGKSAAIAIEAAWAAYKTSGDPTVIAQLILTLGAAAPSVIVAGDFGDVTRKDKDLDEIEAGSDDPLGGHVDNIDELVSVEGNLLSSLYPGNPNIPGTGETGSIEFDWSALAGDGHAFRNPFEEVEGAAGQSAFGMRGDMATVADQRAILDETRSLVSDISDDAYSEQKGLVGKKFDRIREMSQGNQALTAQLCEDDEVKAWLTTDDAAIPSKAAMETALAKILKVLSETPMDENLPAQTDAAIVAALSDDVDREQMTRDLTTMRAELAKLGEASDAPADDQLVFDTFASIRDNMMNDPRVKADIAAGIAEDAAWLDDLRARADLTRLDQFADDPELREAERQKSLGAIQAMTVELKKTEAKLNMLDKASKGAIGVVLAVVPGAGLLAKIRDLVADTARTAQRRAHLKRWTAEMEAMRGNYSVYEYAATGEKEVLAAAAAHDVVQVAADIAGVAAETMRLADQTHVGAAAFTTFEKITKLLNDQWYKIYSADRIREGWTLFKQARAEPENRHLAREAIRINTTLGKCVLAYGACVDKDSQARHAVTACGLTPEVFEDSGDTCQAVVGYLRAQIMDKDQETMAAHTADSNWRPCGSEPTVQNWTMLKAAARRLDPAMAPKYFQTPQIDLALAALVEADAAQARHDAATAAKTAVSGFRPMTTENRPHLEMTIAAQDMVPLIETIRAKAFADLQAAKREAGGEGG